MRTIQIRAEWRRSNDALAAAETLLEAGLYADAVSRAYYAVLHAARAALLAHDVVTESHAGTLRQFGQVLVTKGALDRELGRIVRREQDARIAADYDVETPIARDAANSLVRDAHRFTEAVRTHLGGLDVDLGVRPS